MSKSHRQTILAAVWLSLVVAITAHASQPVNLSTRSVVFTGDGVAIGGFIVTGSAPKHVVLRALGPSLTAAGVPNALSDPVLQLHGPASFTPITNDNWRDSQQAQIIADGVPPTNDLESAIDVTLQPGAYTAIVSGKAGAVGISLVEIYDLDTAAASQLANLSTRGVVGTGDRIMIAGFILANGAVQDRLVIRALGPSLTAFGVPGALADPVLELRDHNGTLVIANDNWQSDSAQAAEISSAGLAPSDPRESAIAATVPPGAYTALMSGSGGTTGNALIEIYHRGPSPIAVTEHLYVADDTSSSGGVLQFDLPITATSLPNFKLTGSYIADVAVDSTGNLAVEDAFGQLWFYSHPLSAASAPSATFHDGSATTSGQITFRPNGDFFVANQTTSVNRFDHPFSNASVVAAAITHPQLTAAFGTALDTAGNLYISQLGNSSLFTYALPYTGAPIITPPPSTVNYRKIAVNGSRLFVTSVTNAVDVYNLPLTASSAPAFSITSGMNSPEAATFDSAGNLYVGNFGNSTVTIFTPPFSSASTPVRTLTINPSILIFSVAVGP